MRRVPLAVSTAPSGARVRGAGAGAVLLLAVLACVVVPAQPAAAHDRLERVEPLTGAHLDRSPGQVQLVFDQAVGRRFSTVVVTGPDGSDRTAGPAQVLDGTVTQPLEPAGPSGVYTVAYRIVSADGHPVTGTSSFTVDTGPAAAGPAGTVRSDGTHPSPAAGRPVHDHGLSGGRVALLGGGFLVLALLAAGWSAGRRRPSDRATHRTGADRS